MQKPKNLNNALLLLGAFLIATAALFIFGWLAEEMLEGDTQRFDSFIRAAIHDHTTPGLTRLMLGFSFLGSVATVGVLCLVILSAFLYFRQIRLAALLAATMIGMAVLDFLLKLAFHRPRPVAFLAPLRAPTVSPAATPLERSASMECCPQFSRPVRLGRPPNPASG